MKGLAAAIIALTVVAALAGCGGVTSINAAESSRLSAAKQDIESQVRANTDIAAANSTARKALPLYRAWLLTHDATVGRELVRMMPSVAAIDPSTGLGHCCDEYLLKLMFAPANSSHPPPRPNLQADIRTITATLAGKSNHAQVPTERNETVAQYLADVYASLGVRAAPAAAALNALAKRLGIPDLSARPQ